jgi:hypothetical protein
MTKSEASLSVGIEVTNGTRTGILDRKDGVFFVDWANGAYDMVDISKIKLRFTKRASC